MILWAFGRGRDGKRWSRRLGRGFARFHLTPFGQQSRNRVISLRLVDLALKQRRLNRDLNGFKMDWF